MWPFSKTLILILSLLSCRSLSVSTFGCDDTVRIILDLNNVEHDKVRVNVAIGKVATDELVFRFPKIIPGTYAIADYGRYIEGFTAYANDGGLLSWKRPDSNTFVISGATKLSGISYLVNDTYDTEVDNDIFSSVSPGIFSPAGSNILADSQFMLNMCAFAGYFDGRMDCTYRITIRHPKQLFGTTALHDMDPSSTIDVFEYNSYAAVVDNPIMYAIPDTASFLVDGMQVLLGVYAPHKNTSARKLLPDLEKTIRAQKKYLGTLNTTKKYAVLVYLTTMLPGDARGLGALEHNNSTSAVFREAMSSSDLVHVIAHEFFHTVSPLKVHSEQIQNFNFTQPDMSEHLWFYEGVTEYFAQLFQVNQGLVSENDFFAVMAGKEENARNYSDTLSFTEMSRHILEARMKKQYPNVYQKGPMIAMCLDILLREKSGGTRGIEDLVHDLSQRYGPERPFKDEEFIPVITKLTSPEIGTFLVDHVQQGKPIDYSVYLGKVGLKHAQVPIPELSIFMHNDQVYIDIDDEKKQVIVNMPDTSNKFFNQLGLKNGDILKSMNGLSFDANDGSSVLFLGNGLQQGDQVELKIVRNGKAKTIKSMVNLNYTDGPGYTFTGEQKLFLKEAWLRRPLNK